MAKNSKYGNWEFYSNLLGEGEEITCHIKNSQFNNTTIYKGSKFQNIEVLVLFCHDLLKEKTNICGVLIPSKKDFILRYAHEKDGVVDKLIKKCSSVNEALEKAYEFYAKEFN